VIEALPSFCLKSDVEKDSEDVTRNSELVEGVVSDMPTEVDAR
jgi:hypothetical protein